MLIGESSHTYDRIQLADIPTQLYQALPFVITAIVLVVTSMQDKKGSGQPASLGLNYFREER